MKKTAKNFFTLALVLIALFIGTAQIVFSLLYHRSPTDVVQLTNSSKEFFLTQHLTTDQGIDISCSDNYSMSNNENSFSYQLSESEEEKGDFLKSDYDWTVTFSSPNAELTKVEYYYYEFDESGLERTSEPIEIGSENVKNNKALVDREYNGKFVDQIKLYFTKGNTIYYAIFAVTGK